MSHRVMHSGKQWKALLLHSTEGEELLAQQRANGYPKNMD